MAQVIVRNLDEAVKRKLKLRAERHGHSMEEEILDILQGALKDEGEPKDKGELEKGLGTRIAERFKGIELDEDIPELRVELRVPKFEQY